MAGPFLSQNLQETASHTKCPPDCHVGTLNGGTILKPEPSGNRIPDEMPPRLSCWNLEWREDCHVGTLDGGTILKPEPSGNRLPHEMPPRLPPPTRNAHPIFMLEPCMVGPFSCQKFQETASQMECLPDFHVGTLSGGNILTLEPSGTLSGGTILKPEPSGNRLPHDMPPRFSCWNLEGITWLFVGGCQTRVRHTTENDGK